MGRVGVAVSTHRRPEVLARALAGWASHLDAADVLVVNHDRYGAGVAATKNAGIAALMDSGCDELFLADSDVWPVVDGWSRPYIKLSQPHACHCWGRSRFICVEGDVSVWSWPRGVLLYLTRDVVEQVGGMRTEFIGAGEHAEYSRRIHNAGFTAHPFMDAAAARDGIWFCEDYERRVPSSLPASRYSPEQTANRHALYDEYRHDASFVEYR